MLRDRLTRPLRAVRRAVLVRRRLLAAALTAIAVATGLHAATAPPPPSVRVLTAARDLPAGTVLAGSDLVEVEFAPDSVPEGLAPDAVGRTLAAPVRSGEPVTDVRLVGEALARSDPDLTALPVRLPDAGHGRPARRRRPDRPDRHRPAGRRRDASSPSDVPVLAIPPADDATGAGGQAGALVVVGAVPSDVTRLADAGVRLFLTYAYVPLAWRGHVPDSRTSCYAATWSSSPSRSSWRPLRRRGHRVTAWLTSTCPAARRTPPSAPSPAISVGVFLTP